MSVARCMQEVSHREYLSWRVYLTDKIEDSYRHPSPTDYYLMQLAFFLYKQQMPKRHAKVGDFLLKFTKKGEEPKLTEEQKKLQLEIAKSAWKVRLGGAEVIEHGSEDNGD